MSLPVSVAGFTILPISYAGTSTHYIYARSHTGSKKNPTPDLPDGRTLFLVNVPPDATERELVLLFKGCGTVEKVVFDLDAQETLVENDDSDSDDLGSGEEENDDDAAMETTQPRKRRKLNKPQPPKVVPLPSRPLRRLRSTGRTAHLVFLDASSLERALAPQPKPRPWPTTSEEPSGLAHYAALYDSLRPPLDIVREHADSAMELYDRPSIAKGEAIVDEDGFTLVTRGGAYGQTLGGGVAVASKVFQETGETGTRKKEKKQKTNFYAFQKAEKQRNDLLELKKNWEADKAKVEKLKSSRRFNPY
ncbi:Ribosomal RNA-processing protein 7 like protein [Mycena sanguinolenta]|uniref:Ribosomal RNA-processing protein 7 like protein n=1 Tax=Mycena sanguinolenta TaxID=230812 RepID=A0A8H6YWJ1_9AGAR|nr:Ribosomal RNA-processing protein 7 like protein [Mycena sanguinolenta]